MDEGDEYVFATHREVVEIVRSLEESLNEALPPLFIVSQIEQMKSGVRDHVASLGCDVGDKDFMLGMLYGAMLSMHVQAQSVVSPATASLMVTLLDFVESEDDDQVALTELQHAVDSISGRKPAQKSVLEQLVEALTRRRR